MILRLQAQRGLPEKARHPGLEKPEDRNDGPRDNDCFRHRNERLSVLDHKKSVTSNGDRTEIALNIPNISKFLGRACALNKAGVYSTKVGTVVLDLSPG